MLTAERGSSQPLRFPFHAWRRSGYRDCKFVIEWEQVKGAYP